MRLLFEEIKKIWRLPEDARARYETHSRLAGEFEYGKYLETSRRAFWKIGALTRFLEEYERFETRDFSDYFAYYEIPAARLTKYAEANAHYNLFSSWSYEDTVNFLSMCAIIAFISAGILLLPYLVTELFKAVPIGAAVGALSFACVFMMFSEQNPVSAFLKIPGAELPAVFLIAFTGLALCFTAVSRVKRKDVL